MNFMIKKRAQILIQPWLNSMLFKKYKSGLKKSLASLDPISPPESTSEDQQNQHSGSDRDNSIYKNNDDHLFGLKDILQNSISDNRDNFSIKLDVENKIVEVDNDHSFLLMSKSKLERSFINHINNCIDNSLQPSIGIETSIVSGIDNYSDSLFINLMVESINSNEVSRTLSYIENSNDEISTDESSNDENSNDENSNNESSNALDNRTTRDRDYSHLWELCENCEWLNYKKFMKMNLCEQCMYHFKMKSSDRIELLIDPGTWEPMDKDMGMEYLDQNLQPLMKFEGLRPSLDKWLEEWKKRTFNLTKSVTKDSEEDSEENVEDNLEEDLDFENYLNKTLKKALKHLDGGDQEALKEALKKSLKDQIKISSGMWKKTLKEAYYFYLTKEDNLEKLWWMKALRESLKEDLEHSEAFLTGMRQLVKTLEKPVKKDSEEDFDEDYKKDSQEDFLKDSRKDSDWAEREEIAREAFKEGLTEEWKEELTKFLQEELTRRRKDWNKDLKERGDEWTKRREEWEKEQREEWEKEQKEEWEKKQRLKELEALEEGEAWKQDENWKQEEGWQQKEDRKQEQDWKQEEGVKQDEDEWKKWKPNWRQELEKVWQIWHKDWIKGLKDEWKNWNPDWEKSWEEVLKKVLKKGLEGRLQETLKAESKDWNPDREKPLTEDFKEDLKQRLQKKAWVKETFENDFEERVKRIDKELTKHWKDWEEEPYPEKILSNQRKTGLIDAVQTGIGQINGIPVAIAVMDFEFIAGSMGSVVGEKITRLIEYATNQFLPLIIVCASGGARMQEGSVSLMQMAKISSALYNYQLITKLFYISILASPTTGGVTASFGMLGDIIIAEPDAYIAFAGKRVIEETLKIEVPEGVQETEYLFEKGSFDLVVPRNFLKIVLSELLKLHAFFPLNENLIKTK